MNTARTFHPLFRLGQIVATPGALKLLEREETDPGSLLLRHRRGDWGTLGEEDWQANIDAVTNGWRVFSSYSVGDERLWIITEADRSATTLLLPEEY